jgi:hypothetical protein
MFYPHLNPVIISPSKLDLDIDTLIVEAVFVCVGHFILLGVVWLHVCFLQ